MEFPDEIAKGDGQPRGPRASPGGGISTRSRARNTTSPNTRRIGCAKLSAVYCVCGLESGKPQSQAGRTAHGVRSKTVNDFDARPAPRSR